MNAHVLDPLSFPLTATRLIEASAGTGKTYTLAALYVRLVLGHGEQHAFERPLLPPEILVMTFTDAATKELRERIHQRLTEAARAFKANDDTRVNDPFLQQLIAQYTNAAERQIAAERLQVAADWMDEAAIYTIHGFCNRMLKQHAFQSSGWFDAELTPDSDDDHYEATCDYWRSIINQLDADCVAKLIEQKISAPRDLLRMINPLLTVIPPHMGALPDALQAWQTKVAAQTAADAAARAALAHELQPLLDWIEDARDQGWLHNRRKYGKSSMPKIRRELEAYMHGHMTKDNIAVIARVSTSDAHDTSLAHCAPEHEPPLQTPDLLAAALASRRDAQVPLQAWLEHAAAWIRARVDALRTQRATLSYNDMIDRLHRALHHDAGGTALAATIRKQYPVALVDEFQDTDAQQYGIFRAIYAQAEHCAWVMIGDPKQAIYGFRGGDIHTYLAAQQAAGAAHYTLARNFRSSQNMVAAINHVFTRANTVNQDAGGAFLETRIPFAPVTAQGRKARLAVDDQPLSGLHIWLDEHDGKAMNGTVYTAEFAAVAARQIAHLLQRAAAGAARFITDDAADDPQPLGAHDMVVLVRDRHEADAMRDALAARGVKSVYLSSRESVWDSTEARDVWHWLRACAAPQDGRLLRNALATPSLAQDFATLDALNHDEAAWERRLDQFRDYQHKWQAHGVLPMLERMLFDFDVPRRLLQRDRGERALVNLRHIAELLQGVAVQLDGERALIRWLDETIRRDTQHDDTELRLETDRNLVRISTIHGAKGLEFPLVFVPFACAFKEPKPERLLRFYDQGQLRLALGADKTHYARALHAAQAEDIRLLYVAMTRAVHACWLGLGPFVKGRSKNGDTMLSQGPLGRVLFGADNVSAEQLQARLAPIINEHVHMVPVAAVPDAHYREPAPDWQPRAALRSHFTGEMPRWWIGSYSALKMARTDVPDVPTVDAIKDDDEPAPTPPTEDAPAPLAESEAPILTGIHAFPRGPEPGNLLHYLLEEAGNHGFARSLTEPMPVDDKIRHALSARQWDAHVDSLQAWWKRFMQTPLPLAHGQTMTLADLDISDYVPEMEFLFAVAPSKVATMDALVCRHVYPERALGAQRPPFMQDDLYGMLKGFMDLVFCHQGRYYVLDYKSNWLGETAAAYSHDAMQAAILQHRYDMQYVLYLVALQRLLKSRLGPRYDPATHLGGAVYVFLRGNENPHTHGAIFDRPEQTLIDALDALFTAGEAVDHVA